MQYLLLVYIDDAVLDKLPAPEFDSAMRQCLRHADEPDEGCFRGMEARPGVEPG